MKTGYEKSVELFDAALAKFKSDSINSYRKNADYDVSVEEQSESFGKFEQEVEAYIGQRRLDFAENYLVTHGQQMSSEKEKVVYTKAFGEEAEKGELNEQ